jgi:DNA-binding CsgD family transcriptional regulator
MASPDRELEHELLSEPVFEDAPPQAARDYVSLIEAAYDLSGSDAEWLRGLVRSAFPMLNRGFGVVGFFWDLSQEGKLRVSHPALVGCPPAMYDALLNSGRRLTLAEARLLYMQGKPCRVLGLDGALRQYPRAYAAYRAHIDAPGFNYMTAANLSHTGCLLMAPRSSSATAVPTLGPALDQVARHVATGLRLRRTLGGSEASSLMDSADAVLDSEGRLLHAAPGASGRRERGSFVSAARRMLESRGARRARPEQAVELWRALVLGRWSLVDHVDRDGKRFLLARRNAPGAHEPAALSEQEQRVLAVFSLLGSIKLVAYELGLSPSTISLELKSVCRKLGCRDRAELAGLVQSDVQGTQ